MDRKKIKIYGKDVEPRKGVTNAYDTSRYAFKQPTLHYLIAPRGGGKSFSTSKLIKEAQKEKTFDQIYMVTPTFNSNKEYFGDFIPIENVYSPTKTSIQEVIERVEADRDEFEEHLQKLEDYNQFMNILKSKRDFTDEEIVKFDMLGFLSDEPVDKPVFKYEEFSGKLRPPTSAVILDDILGQPAILQSSGLDRLASTNRHTAPLKETFDGRSSCGLAVYILAQKYKCVGGVGTLLRENVQEITIFENKSKKQLDSIKEELASVINEDYFEQALAYATSKKHGHLTISFSAKCPSMTFRSDFNELLIFPGMECSCGK